MKWNIRLAVWLYCRLSELKVRLDFMKYKKKHSVDWKIENIHVDLSDELKEDLRKVK